MGKNSVQGNERNSLTTIELNKTHFRRKSSEKGIVKNNRMNWKKEILQLKKQNKEQNSNIGNTYIRH